MIALNALRETIQLANPGKSLFDLENNKDLYIQEINFYQKLLECREENKKKEEMKKQNRGKALQNNQNQKRDKVLKLGLFIFSIGFLIGFAIITKKSISSRI